MPKDALQSRRIDALLQDAPNFYSASLSPTKANTDDDDWKGRRRDGVGKGQIYKNQSEAEDSSQEDEEGGQRESILKNEMFLVY